MTIDDVDLFYAATRSMFPPEECVHEKTRQNQAGDTAQNTDFRSNLAQMLGLVSE